MPNNDGKVRVEITGDISGIKKELKEIENAIQNMKRAVSEMTDNLEDTLGSGDIFDIISETAKKTGGNQMSALGGEKDAKRFGNSGDDPNFFDGIGGDMGGIMKMFMGSDFTDIAAKVTSAVLSEQARYSAPAYAAAVMGTVPNNASADGGNSKSDIEAILEKLNKPINVMLDGKVIAEAVITYQNNYMRKTGG